MYSDSTLALSDVCSGFEALRPPNRMRVSEGAAANLVIRQPGAAGGPWSPSETPYMVEPMDMLASRQHEAVIFVGPARTGKSAGLLLGWMAHNVVNDPGDMLFVHLNKDKAREFSKTDVDRAIRHSPAIAGMRSPRAIDSNTFDTMFRHGMWTRIAWPTVSNVSGSTYRYVAITDIDRIENAENVDGEGPLFDLAKKRTTTFMSRGMTLVESSPGYPITDPSHVPATPHEAPPTGGILSLYNRSDRNRQHWQCPDCSEFFQAAPGLALFSLMPSDQVLLEEVRTMNIGSFARHHAKVVCPHCASVIEPSLKTELNRTGIWLPDGVRITAEREIIGTPLQSTIKGYWLGGVAAAYQSWSSIVEQYLYGLREYALTGSEEKLKATTNTDQGAPYMPRHLADAKGSNKSPRERAERDSPRYLAPAGTRLLTASVDVQGGQNARFEVQVVATGANDEKWLVDRFPIKDSMREGMTGPGSFAPLDPAAYEEDWDVLTEKVLRATWRTPIDGLEMQVAAMIVDTGGEEGTTEKAYAYYRRVREQGLQKRVKLYKGGSDKKAPILRESLVGKIGRKGKDDIPLLVCNTNLLSDAVDAGLRRQTPGPGYYHFPEPKHPTKNPEGWLPEAFFDELAAEVRNPDGTWTKIRKRNETFDLLRMDYALKLHMGVYKVLDWNNVPAWLAPLEQNSAIVAAETRRELQENEPVPPQPTAVRVIQRPQRRRRSTAPT